MKFNTLIPRMTLILAATASLMLSGCAITFQSKLSNVDVYGADSRAFGYVIQIRQLDAEKDCPAKKVNQMHEQICNSPSKFLEIYTNTHSKFGTIRKQGLFAPIDAGIKVDDIIEFETTVRGVGSTFIRIASRPDSPNRKTCDWMGSKILGTGGIECDGYSYKNLPHFKL